MKRVTHKDVEYACELYNKAIGAKSPQTIGHVRWSDIRGDGRNKRGLYVTINENGGVGSSDLRRRTMRQTIAALRLAALATKSKNFAVIIRAIHERGETQIIALRELNRRGLWLSPEQRQQAGLEGVE